MLKATNLRCEYLSNPIGIGVNKPRFSWIIESDNRNVVQTSYEIQVSNDRDFKNLLWSSGVVESDESAHVYYEGLKLQSSSRYYYKVKISDNHGEISDFSETAFFETTLFSSDEWQARFITAEGIEEGKNSKGTLLRKEFKISKEIESAGVYATALGMYELRINGKRVGDALFTPGWTAYNKRLQFQTYDVTDMLLNGSNAIGAVLGAGWYKGDLAGWIGRRNVYGDKTALLFQMKIRFKDGSESVIVSGDEWKASDSPILYSELYHGETYDARLEEISWDRAGYDDSAWEKAQYVDFDFKRVVPQDGIYVKRQETLKAKALFTTPKGESVIDFGQNLAGWVKFNASGNSGDRVILKHAEVLDKDGNFYIENMRAAKVRIEYILKGQGEETFEPHFTFQGFRYVLIEEYPGNPKLEDFEAIVVHSDMEGTGTFSCSNELLNQLNHNILWGLKGNFIDIPTDCPQRDERLGWTGDAQVFISTANFLMDTALFYRKWLRDLKAEQVESGGVPFVIPDVLSNNLQADKIIKEEHSATGWADAAVICPWTLYQSYGDIEVLKEQYETMKKWLGYIKARAKDGLIWNTGFHFGDWVALDAKEGAYIGATPTDLIATAYYAYSTKLTAQTARVLGKLDDAEEYETLYGNIVRAFQDEFYTPRGRLAAKTQTAHILSLMFDLTPIEHKERTIKELLKLLEENKGHLTTGFLGTPYFCQVLSDNGQLEAAYDLLLKEDYPSWLYQVKMGATTIWEHWDGIKPDGTMWSADMNSFNHYAYGAIGDWLYKVIAGINIDPSYPGYKRIIIKPRPGGGITNAKGSIKTMYGQLSVEWDIKDGYITVNVQIPHNTKARLILPKAMPEYFEGGEIVLTPCEGGCEGIIGSGEHVFKYEYQ